MIFDSMDPPENSIDDNIKPSPDPIKLLIPAYFYTGLEWERLANKASDMPGLIYIIANPDNGPGKKKNINYKTVIENFRKNRGKVFGYIYTQYGNRNIKEINKY